MQGDAQTAPRPTLVLGARGWEHAGWSGSYYPPDLPPEWRLAYYANEFRTVLVPAERLACAAPAELAAWRGAVREEFRFFLELTVSLLGGDALLERIGALEGRLGGLVLRFDAPPPDLQGLLGRLPRELALSIAVGEPGVEALDGSVAAAKASWCWSPNLAARHGAVGLIRMGPARYGLRALRAQIEAFLAGAPAAWELFLFVEGDPPEVQALRDGETIARLLGA
jgi:hypothetical protein